MPLEIRPLKPADVPTFYSISSAALGPSAIGRAMHDDPPHPAYVEKRIQRIRNALEHKPHSHYVAVVDTDNNDEIIAGANWEFFDNGRSDEELKEMEQPFEPVKEEGERRGRVQQDFFAYLNGVRAGLGKKPHYFLSLLITHPNHHRRGAGAMLLRWGTAQADKAGVICFLEATETGRPLYKRHGFEDIETYEFDLSKYGFEGVERNTTMIRQPVKN